MAEYDNVKKLNSKLKYDYLKEVLVGMEKEPMKIGGYDVFITSDIEKIKKQCDTLYQCLIRNDYIGKVIQQEEILVFFWKDGEPKYTAEVFYNGKVGQFYGDERDNAHDAKSKILGNPALVEVVELLRRELAANDFARLGKSCECAGLVGIVGGEIRLARLPDVLVLIPVRDEAVHALAAKVLGFFLPRGKPRLIRVLCIALRHLLEWLTGSDYACCR